MVARRELQAPRKPRWLFSLLGLLALALLLEGRGGGAAPLPSHEGASPMAQIFPRGSQWAVGHFMGKKSAGEFPSIYEEQNKPPFSQMMEYLLQAIDRKDSYPS